MCRVSVSLQPLGCRRAEPVAAGGQHRHRGLPHSPGHAERLHHGVQGDVAKPVWESSDGDFIGLVFDFFFFMMNLPVDPAVLGPRTQPADEEGV